MREAFLPLRDKIEMRYTMEDEKFNSLILLRTQNDITIEIDYNDIIDDYGMIKARKKPLLCKNDDTVTTKNKDV
ncbi:hypothetical protein TNCV_3804751 [Trichonephila clavipes]|nr:hypothetical protein TNCV_3804751 [Trichonephila clavipes]